MALIKIPGTNFVRDTETMALVNKDVSGLEEYKMKRRMMESQKHEINNVKSDIDDIKNDVLEIKEILIKLLKGSNV